MSNCFSLFHSPEFWVIALSMVERNGHAIFFPAQWEVRGDAKIFVCISLSGAVILSQNG
jgi:hypothetical protein